MNKEVTFLTMTRAHGTVAHCGSGSSRLQAVNLYFTYLLCISAVSYRFIFVVLKNYMAKLRIWNILDDMPFDWEKTIPFILLPKVHVLTEINPVSHLSYPTKLTTSIYLIKE